jgi:curli production assembly/transport component CsgG
VKKLALLLVLGLAGCASVPTYNQTGCVSWLECREEPKQISLPTYEQLLKIPPAVNKVVVAVYNFNDLTGQRKSKDNIASFSTAVSQGGTEMLIDALKTAGAGTWFRVVERAGIDHLVRERQIIRSTREEHEEDKDLQPLLFAGILIEGGIIGYDTNIESGGRGARYLGVGRSTKYRRDVVTVSLRGVSTLTGEVLINVQSRKTILSYGAGFDVFRFIDMDTELIEYEDGVARNEEVTFATRAAIEAAVVAFIEQGDSRGFWEIQKPEGEVSEEKGT